MTVVGGLMAAWLLAITDVQAAEKKSYYLETGPLPAKADAAAAEARIPGGGGVRILRRYVEGAGWRYVLVADAEGTPDDVAARARALASATGLTWTLAEVDDHGALSPVSTFAPVESAGGGRAQLESLVAALGGEQAGLRLVAESPTLTFRFRRSVVPELVAEHVVVRAIDKLRLDVRVVEGSGVSSSVGIGPGGAWLMANGVLRDADAASARAQVERFLPGAVLPLALRLPNEALTWSSAEVDVGEPRTIQGKRCESLVRRAAAGRPDLTLTVCSGTLARVDLGSEASIDLSGWTRTGEGLVYPGRVEVRRGEQLVEVVEVEEFSLSNNLSGDPFAKPNP